MRLPVINSWRDRESERGRVGVRETGRAGVQRIEGDTVKESEF